MSITTRVISSLGTIAAADWNAVANPDAATYNPFISHAFLWALEKSGSANAKSGWQASHLLLEDNGKIVAACPCYL